MIVVQCIVGKAIDALNAVKPAVCTKCGYKGRTKSKRPDLYRCTYCYYTAWADGTERQIETLLARIEKLRAEVIRMRGKAEAFRKKYPEAGGKR